MVKKTYFLDGNDGVGSDTSLEFPNTYQLFCPLFKNQERDLKSKKTSNYSGPYRDLDLLEWSWSEQEPSD